MLQFSSSFLKNAIIVAAVFCFGSVIGQDKSIDQLTPLLKQAEENDDFDQTAFYAYEIAKKYKAVNNPDQAIDYLEQTVKYSKKGDDDLLQYFAIKMIANIYFEADKNGRALTQYKKASKLAKQIGKNAFISNSLLELSTCYATMNRYNRAVEPIEEALEVANKEKDLLLRQECYLMLNSYYTALNDESQALIYQKLYDASTTQSKTTEINTDIHIDDATEEGSSNNLKKYTQRSKRTTQLQSMEDSLLATKYSLQETEKSLRNLEEISGNQQLEIDLLQRNKELADLEIREQRALLKNAALIRNSIIIVTLLSIIIVFVLIRSHKKKTEASKEIDQKNKKIQSSINYAQRIQEAMLMQDNDRKKLLPMSFVMFKPRDSVSGDFYWFTEIKSWYDPDVCFAAVDCTGHGIPGAFMSLIGINALNNIVRQGEAEPQEILEKLDVEIRTTLKQDITGNRDGMDISLCIYRKEKGHLEFAGAKNPLVYIQDGELYQIKGNSRAIGGRKPSKKKPTPFTKHTIEIDRPTYIYLFSDGFQDQFGGENNTKFMSKRFKALLLSNHTKSMEEQQRILSDSIDDWRDKERQTDDILVMGVRLDPVEDD